jgi:hypothetical protein
MKLLLTLGVVLTASFAYAQDTVLQCTTSRETGLAAVYIMKGRSTDKLLKIEVPHHGKQNSAEINSEDLVEGYIWLNTPAGVDERVLAITDGGAWDIIDMVGGKATYYPAYCQEIED